MQRLKIIYLFIWFCCVASGVCAAELTGTLALDDPSLRRLENAVAAYREIAARDPWPAVPAGPTLRPGAVDARMPALREVLRRTGDLTLPDSGIPTLYAPEIADAVRSFQRRHGLNPDAAIGPATRTALAVPAADRARQIALNLARLRELKARLPSDAVVVNIPDFSLINFSNGEPVWRTRVIVGKPSWPTPTFDSVINRIELNPYWNVPRSIMRRELAPLIAADPGYLARHDMKLLPGNRLRQDPGPDNPLGQIKFQVPNPYDVYLHDTPGKRSFALQMRALSHGCVRVENAMDLAQRLLAAEPGWDAKRLAAEIATGRNAQIPLSRPVPVLIVYITAWIDPSGLVEFRSDLYHKDAGKASAALAANPNACGAAEAG
jgi:murein L,D-transpeptidase YcbB/YkuD